ncbi:helix-turn-helix domain-containing protein [Mycobacterium paragordonae]|uniref:HTH cro/C1-type domain-containing protein n=1 Tax=Mycobacterium paragordonae TaxID=1389713 RepID=A0ABQ1CAZ3_9MYCO|nr:helix-turn-helix domain-containing protein [Mycobacterium paragordonae]GFG81651.1 hypothetical protein MPRG_49270 [Mycobacterium paragordonae]
MDDTDDVSWPALLAQRLGELIYAARKARNMTAVKLAEEAEKIGVPIHRVAITRIERGEQSVAVPELIALGVALDTDWTWWLIKAADGLSIKGESGRRDDLRAILADTNAQIAAMWENLRQAIEAPKHYDLPDALREKLQEDAESYRGMLASLQANRDLILRMLEEVPPGA